MEYLLRKTEAEGFTVNRLYPCETHEDDHFCQFHIMTDDKDA